MNIDLEKGDDILGGKWKNKKDVVKKIGTDDLGQPTINGKPMLKFRIAKAMPKKEIVEDTESLIKRYGLFSNSGILLSFKNDPAEYMLKGLTPDRTGVFVSLKNQAQTYRKKISDLLKVNRKPIIENSSYLKEMPNTDKIANSLGSTKRNAEKDFIPELSFAFRDAFTSFLDVMEHNSITKIDPRFNQQFKELYPGYLQTALRSLYYKYTVGRYNYLNTLPYQEFINAVMPFMVTTQGSTFYDNLKNITLQAAKAVQDKLPKQESMKEDKALKVKVLLDKVLIEAKTSKTIKENTDDSMDGEQTVGESENPEDVIKMDVPFLIRVMEFAKEDAKSDMDLHQAAEKMVSHSKEGDTLSMNNYDAIFSVDKELTEYKNPMQPDSKDEMRIQDLLYKAQMSSPNSLSPLSRMADLARLMANKITDPNKAYRRYKAAEDANFHNVALVFYKRYRDLGGK